MGNKVEIYGVDLISAKPFCRSFNDENSFTEWQKTDEMGVVIHSMEIDGHFKLKPLGLRELRLWGIYQILTNPGIRARLPRLTKLAYELHQEKF